MLSVGEFIFQSQNWSAVENASLLHKAFQCILWGNYSIQKWHHKVPIFKCSLTQKQNKYHVKMRCKNVNMLLIQTFPFP